MTNAKTDDPRRPSIQLQVQPPGPSGGVDSERSRVLRQRMLNSVFHRCSLTGLGCLRTSSGGKQGVLPDPLDEPAALPSSGALLPAP